MTFYVDGHQIDRLFRHRDQERIHFEQIADEIDRFQRAHAQVIQRFKHQISKVMPGKLPVTAKTVLKHRRGDARFGN
ncbi:Uncharacterised protein [Enterobacter cloacae]|uniref:Uncharacterized protein n=1 Tax=Enterobacter cloacae TaxID=550 RepID=A0A377M6B8_ENTCL|nr:Uncharacterised protein [Enterobacter cloacae]